MFLWCLKKTNVPITNNVKNKSLCSKNDVTVTTAVALNEARDEYLKAKNTITQVKINTKVMLMLSAINTPRVVATPFPPLNFNHIGNMCPKTAKIADVCTQRSSSLKNCCAV